MKEQIEAELKRFEQEHNIKILYAVESGSRAWGFASTDSDWDVRFIYLHNRDWYLSIDDKSDNIEEILPNDIDLSVGNFARRSNFSENPIHRCLNGCEAPLFIFSNFQLLTNYASCVMNILIRNPVCIITCTWLKEISESICKRIWCGLRNISMSCDQS